MGLPFRRRKRRPPPGDGMLDWENFHPAVACLHAMSHSSQPSPRPVNQAVVESSCYSFVHSRLQFSHIFLVCPPRLDRQPASERRLELAVHRTRPRLTAWTFAWLSRLCRLRQFSLKACNANRRETNRTQFPLYIATYESVDVALLTLVHDISLSSSGVSTGGGACPQNLRWPPGWPHFSC